MKRVFVLLLLPVYVALGSCGGDHADSGGGHDHGSGGHSHPHDAHATADEPESWSVTSWGEHFEIFAETDPLDAGKMSKSHTHVTLLDGFLPVTEGRVSAILRSGSGPDYVFTRDQALRAGIFSIEITPEVAGEFDLIFRVEAGGRAEDIPSGRVRIGGPDWSGGIVSLPPRPDGAGAPSSANPVGFLKEQQWKTEFATTWSLPGKLSRTVRGTGRIRGAGAGDIVVSAPVNGIVAPEPVAHVGLSVRSGQAVMRLRPRAGADQSLSELRSELAVARSRLERLEKLITVGAVSTAELEAARARVTSLMPLVEPTGKSELFDVTSPLTGRIAAVWALPGRAVGAGDSLMRVVKTNPVWVEVALGPEDALALERGAFELYVRLPGSQEPIRFDAEGARLVAVSPALHPVTGKVTALVEVADSLERLRIGASVDVEISTAVADSGIVVPITALVDDGGATVVYEQIEGESFERREVKVVTSAGGRAIIAGIDPGSRLVTRGGAMVRRASMLSSGAIEGHVH